MNNIFNLLRLYFFLGLLLNDFFQFRISIVLCFDLNTKTTPGIASPQKCSRHISHTPPSTYLFIVSHKTTCHVTMNIFTRKCCEKSILNTTSTSPMVLTVALRDSHLSQLLDVPTDATNISVQFHQEASPPLRSLPAT